MEKVHDTLITSMHVKGGFVWVGTQSGDISVWTNKRKLETVLKKHKSQINCISSTTNDCNEENWVYTCDNEGHIHFWNPYGLVKT